MIKNIAKTALLGGILALSGCTSIVSKSDYPTTIDSDPSGINVTVFSGNQTIYRGVTPAHLVLKAGNGYFKKAHYKVTFSGKGFPTQSFNITPTIDGWYFGNLGFGGVIGFLIVDPITGAMYKLNDTYRFTLDKHPQGVKVYLLKDVPHAWKKHLEPIK